MTRSWCPAGRCVRRKRPVASLRVVVLPTDRRTPDRAEPSTFRARPDRAVTPGRARSGGRSATRCLPRGLGEDDNATVWSLEAVPPGVVIVTAPPLRTGGFATTSCEALAERTRA